MNRRSAVLMVPIGGMLACLTSQALLSAQQPPRSAASPAINIVASSECPAPPSAFGSTNKMPVGVEGKIYFLEKNTRVLPDFSGMESQGSIYAAKWDVPVRVFKEGFPGVTDRFEWFAIDYQGSIYISKTGVYEFRLFSDDGSILYLDGKVVVNADGLHPWARRINRVELAEGDHAFRLSYFQGPAYRLGLQLWVAPPGERPKIFSLQDFSKAVQDSRDLLSVTEDDKEIRVNVGAEVLFDTGKHALRPAATATLDKLAILLTSYPGFPILVEGHTDSVGTAESNQSLSDNRANAVKEWLTSKGTVPSGCMMSKGYGETLPVTSNDSADGRQKNRRVEIKLLKGEAKPKP